MRKSLSEPGVVPALVVLAGMLVAGAGALALAVTYPDRSAELEAERYCRMVWIHQHDSRYGWPDYAGVFAEQCRNDGSVNEDYVHGR